MLAKKHQLRAELRGHLAQVLEERGLSSSPALRSIPSNASTPTSASALMEKKREYARALQMQMEERRRQQESQGRTVSTNEAINDPVWFTRREETSFDDSKSFLRRKMSPEQQKQVLFEQMEEARRRREAEERRLAEEAAKWEDFAMSTPRGSKSKQRTVSPAKTTTRTFINSPGYAVHGKDDWEDTLQQTRQRISTLKREMDSIARQLDQLVSDESRLLEFIQNQPEAQTKEPRHRDWHSSPLRNENQTASSIPKVATAPQLDLNAPMQPLNVTARYFVYVSKSPEAIHEEDELSSSFVPVSKLKEPNVLTSITQRSTAAPVQVSISKHDAFSSSEDGFDGEDNASVIRGDVYQSSIGPSLPQRPKESNGPEFGDSDFDENESDEEDDENIKRMARLTLQRSKSEEEDINSFIERDLFDTRSTASPAGTSIPPSFDL